MIGTFFNDIRAGFRQRLLTLSDLPQVHWEGTEYASSVGVPFITEVMVPISSVVTAPGSGGVIAHNVLMTLTLHYPTKAGTNAIESMAAAIMDLFRPGNSVSYESTVGVIHQTERAGAAQEPDWINLSVTVTVIGHTTN